MQINDSGGFRGVYYNTRPLRTRCSTTAQIHDITAAVLYYYRAILYIYIIYYIILYIGAKKRWYIYIFLSSIFHRCCRSVVFKLLSNTAYNARARYDNKMLLSTLILLLLLLRTLVRRFRTVVVVDRYESSDHYCASDA